ncbi:porin [Anaeromyxobacter oryzae]|uniref:Phosphate-selective porin O and P n=1 Tax=Anaeromyxobacter oryzae TaxID=2918170 RepID=A0ABM7WNZ7_9BACT|nr:porin [Anaeromyxobacter oryzae]BDG01186.1 hypothetical protein AMOR_01820 [Anaeromyxobacter oryzae]
MNRIFQAALAVALLVSSRAGAQEGPKAAPDAPASSPEPVAPAEPAAPPASAPQGQPPRPPSPPAADAPPKPTAAAPYAPTFWGFVNVQYARTDPPAPGVVSSTFQLRRARIGARGDVTPNVGYAVLFDGADTSLKDAYAALKPVRGLELRLGQWKTPFGYEQPESDTKLLWVNSSYVVQALARSTSTTSVNATPDSRDLGVGLLGKWTAGAIGAELAGSLVNGAGPNRTDDLDTKNAWGRAGVLIKGGRVGVRAGGSFGYGRQVAGLGANGKFDGVGTPVDDTYFWFKTYGADVEVDTPIFFAAAEWIQSERDVRTYTSATSSTASAFTARGWYAGVYGKTPWNLGPIFRAERYDRNRNVAGDTNERYTIGAYVDAVPLNARLIFNYEADRSEKAVRTGDKAIVFGQVIF